MQMRTSLPRPEPDPRLKTQSSDLEYLSRESICLGDSTNPLSYKFGYHLEVYPHHRKSSFATHQFWVWPCGVYMLSKHLMANGSICTCFTNAITHGVGFRLAFTACIKLTKSSLQNRESISILQPAIYVTFHTFRIQLFTALTTLRQNGYIRSTDIWRRFLKVDSIKLYVLNYPVWLRHAFQSKPRDTPFVQIFT